MTQPKTHRVRSGETLSSIATLETVDKLALAKLNDIKNINFIRKGQILKLPPKIKATPTATPPKPQTPPKPEQAQVKSITETAEDWTIAHVAMASVWVDELLQRLRTVEANEHIQKIEKVPVPVNVTPPAYAPAPPVQPSSTTLQTLAQVKVALKESLGKEPHIVVFNGVKMTANEKKQIVASVGLCEMNGKGFASMNEDTEFIGRHYQKHGIETGYSRIVHIGLSYGVIQFTQDSGSLGKLLTLMKERNPAKFVEIFGDGNSAVADSLLTLTTTGRPDLLNNTAIPLSGQSHWNQIKNTDSGQVIKSSANGQLGSNLPVASEIRGKRVQPIPPKVGAAPIDIWKGSWKDRFLLAGQVFDFQDVQLESAVKNYFDPILPKAKVNKVRAALSLAFIGACAIRGGPSSNLSKLFYRIAAAMEIALPFTSAENEKRCLDKIADCPLPPHPQETTVLLGITVHKDEIRRAKLLRNDQLGFLTEDLYDISTYE